MATPVPSPPVALTIAGSDCSAGAGIQADLKTFQAWHVYGLTAVTSVVAETSDHVGSMQSLPASLVREQVELLLASYSVSALKTGLLASRETVETLTEALETCQVPVVVDPIAIASTGTDLTDRGYREALWDLIARRATVVTPNRLEAEAFLKRPLRHETEAREGALQLQREWDCAVLLKGGHFSGGESIDWLVTADGFASIARERLEKGDFHGTGCTYSAAITAALAQGFPLLEAVEKARDYLQNAMTNHLRWTGDPPGKALAHTPESVQS